MDIFVGNLPGTATLMELHAFVGDVSLRADFHCLRGHDRHGHPYHYFIARAKDRAEGLRLIAKLNGRVFEGRPVVVRECIQRAVTSDWEGEERRINAG